MKTYFLRRFGGRPCMLSKGVREVYPELPFSLIERLLNQKDVFVNGKRQRHDFLLSEGDMLDLYCTPDMIKLRVVYSDENLLVLYKPRGVESSGMPSFASLVQYVYGENAQPLHRLDTNTDGLLLFSLNDAAYEVLYKAMREHRIVKYYSALVYGAVSESRTLEGYLLKDVNKSKVTILHKPVREAKPVACQINPIRSRDGLTLLEVMLKGGKTHQLRAQLADYGHFIMGDGKYGDDRINRQYGYAKQQLTADKICMPEGEDLLGLNGKEFVLPDRYRTIHF